MHPYIEKEHVIPAYEVDVLSLWRPDAIFRCMQEVAGLHADELGCGRMALLSRNIVWMLAKIDLRMHEYPKLFDTVTIRTWPGPTGRITFPRYFIFTDQNGRQIGEAATSWVLVDLTSRRILPPVKAKLTFPDTSHLTPPLPEPTRFRLQCQGTPKILERIPAYAEVDMNAHMNNASYISWVLDLFPIERHKNGRIHSLAIHYAAEAVPGELVRMSLYEQGDDFEVLGVDPEDNHTIFEVNGSWREP